MKLFNTLMAELGPVFLSRGLIVEKGRLKELFDASPQAFQEHCDHASIDGRAFPVENLGAEIAAVEVGVVFLRALIPEKEVLHQPAA